MRQRAWSSSSRSAMSPRRTTTRPNRANDDCKFEFDSALLSQHLGANRIVPVVMEPRMRNPAAWPNGTVKGKLGPKLYVDLAEDGASFQGKVAEIAKEVRTVTGGRGRP